jgi:glycolate oxidase iron-sulfur subunit
VPAEVTSKRGCVGLARGCVMSVLFGRTHNATVNLLNRLGYDVVLPVSQGCCGALDAHSGNLERAREWARQNLKAFATHRVDAVISNAAGCGSTLKEYGELLAHDPEWASAARKFSSQVKDLTEFLAQPELMSELTVRMSVGAGDTRTLGTERVTVHDACHLAHAQQITQPPRDLVKAAAGNGYVELPESDVCCGSAGSYNLTQPGMAGRLRSRKVRNILETEARTVITTNPGCILQIQAGLEQAGAGSVRVRHIAEFLLDAWEESPPGGQSRSD